MQQTSCPVCSFPETDTECLLCKTPHHLDCWYYNEKKCAIFGCPSIHNTEALEDFQRLYRKSIAVPTHTPRRYNDLPIFLLVGIFVFVFFILPSFSRISLSNVPVVSSYESEYDLSEEEEEEEEDIGGIPVLFSGEYAILMDGGELKKVELDRLSRDQAWRLFIISTESLSHYPFGSVGHSRFMSSVLESSSMRQ